MERVPSPRSCIGSRPETDVAPAQARTTERQGYANGYKPKTVTTRVGDITFALPQMRDGSFYPSALERGLGSGNLPQTPLGFTGQRLDSTGLLYYHARMYDPVLARFVSADSVVPGSASGSIQGIALKPLTVDFHEVGLGATLHGENGQPFWFQLSNEDKQKAGDPWGPTNPQALNRYSYVLNGPVRYNDPSGHVFGPCLGYQLSIKCLKEIWQRVKSVVNAAAIFVIKLIGGDVAWWGDKIARQMPRRGWTENDIKDVLENPSATAKTINKATGNSATQYYRSDGYYVVRDDVTGEIIQVSDRTDPDWKDSLTNKPVEPKP